MLDTKVCCPDSSRKDLLLSCKECGHHVVFNCHELQGLLRCRTALFKVIFFPGLPVSRDRVEIQKSDHFNSVWDPLMDTHPELPAMLAFQVCMVLQLFASITVSSQLWSELFPSSLSQIHMLKPQSPV